MQLDRQAERVRRVEHARDLRGREGDALAEGVDRVGQARRRATAGSMSSQTASM